ncbi:hypothetical protein ACQ858_05615 [Variovorax ureilyticus]|uniref:hypothetical protein n=1 Tax=Variovorax ureilyticus TaxID=1836198 RepID=UPI003D669BE9
MERSFMSAWLDNAPQARPPRPARRMQYIAPIVEALKDQLPSAARKRLAAALALTMGTEAALSLHDVAGTDTEQSLAVSAWAAQALVRQALAEASDAREAREEREGRGTPEKRSRRGATGHA